METLTFTESFPLLNSCVYRWALWRLLEHLIKTNQGDERNKAPRCL